MTRVTLCYCLLLCRTGDRYTWQRKSVHWFQNKQNLAKQNSLEMYNTNDMQISVKSWQSQQASLSQW